MGRGPDPNAGSSPHQTPETIDDAPPLEDNLQENYENQPPQPSKPQNNVHQTRSPATDHDTNDHHQPHAFPPPQRHDHHQPQAFPPPQDDPHKPQAFPPPQHHDHDDFQKPQAFPPAQSHEAHPFPPHQQHQGFQGAHAFPPQQHGAFQHQSTPQINNNNFSGVGPNPVMHQPGQMPFNSSNSPMPGVPFPQPLPTEPWKTDLFGCMEDPQNAIVTACFPCVTFGQIADIIDSGHSSCATSGMMYGCVAFLIAIPCLLSCTYRTKLRARYGLMETPGPDWLVHCVCEWCALCQEYRELQKRGLDPAIGWQGNQARQMMQLGSMTPPMRQNMMA